MQVEPSESAQHLGLTILNHTRMLLVQISALLGSRARRPTRTVFTFLDG